MSSGRIAIGDGTGASAVFDRPAAARWLYLFGHGAGAGMRHPFMEDMAARFVERAAHLRDVPVPMLFVQGTRDRLAGLDLMADVWGGLGGRSSAHVVEGGDHSFEVLKRSGRTRDGVLDEIADAVAGWLERTIPA